jgi:hypothetical protein
VDQIQTARLESYNMKIIYSASYKPSINGANEYWNQILEISLGKKMAVLGTKC